MNPKTFLAFALGCFVAGGAAFLLSGPPEKVVPKPKPPAVAVETETAAVTPDRVISAAAPVAVEAVKVDPPAHRSGFISARAVVAARKPSPAAVAKVKLAPKPTSAAPVAPAPIPVVVPPVSAEPVSQPLKIDVPPPPAPTEPVAQVTAPQPAAPPKANTVIIAAGTMLSIRLQEALSSERNMAGDAFQAVLEQPVIVDGFVIAEKGARVEGKVTESDRGGKVKGIARLVLEVTRIHTSDGQRVAVQTSAMERKAEQSRKSDALKVGLGAAIGAAIGGIAGGGKGAAAGAGAGGAAGAGQVLLTRGKEASLAVESRLSFRLQEPVTLTERLSK